MLLQRATKIVFSFGKALELHQHYAHQVERANVFRFGTQHSFEEALGVIELAGPESRQSTLKLAIIRDSLYQR